MSTNNPLLDPVIYQIHRIEEFGIRKISLIIYILIGVLSVDTVINQISNLPGVHLSSSFGVAVFLMVSFTTIICQLFVVRFVGKKSISIRNRVTSIRRMHRALSIAQYSIITVFIFVILQILLTHPYSPILALVVSFASYGLSISLMGIFTILFLRWYRHNRSSVLVLLYGVSFATVLIASVSLLSIWVYLFSGKVTMNVYPASKVIFPLTGEGSIWRVLAKIYQYSDMASFFLKWGGTALILYHYSKKIGKIKYWFLLSLPVAYFSTLLVYTFHLYDPHLQLERLIFFGFASLNSTFGGILFYMAFKLSSKNFKGNQVIADYLLIAGYGFILFFSGTQATLVNTAYPPFGFATVSSYGIGSYLLLVGLYLSALSVSEDNELRNMIKASALSESKFLHSIGLSAAEREKTIVNDVLDKAKHQQEIISEEIGIRTSLSENDIKDYVKEIEDNEMTNKPKKKDKI
jgi:hypothetical protein